VCDILLGIVAAAPRGLRLGYIIIHATSYDTNPKDPATQVIAIGT